MLLHSGQDYGDKSGNREAGLGQTKGDGGLRAKGTGVKGKWV